MDILLTRPAAIGAFDIPRLTRELREACQKVRAVTVAHHTDPYGVFVHLHERTELTAEERRTVEEIVLKHQKT